MDATEPRTADGATPVSDPSQQLAALYDAWTGIPDWPGFPIPIDITVAYELDWDPAALDDDEPLRMPGMTYETTITVPITPGINAAIDAILGGNNRGNEGTPEGQ